MRQTLDRRALLIATASAPFAAASTLWPSAARASTVANDRFGALEASTGGRLGVSALDTADGTQVNYRADERFAFCSTFKFISVSAILKRSETERSLLQKRIAFTKDEVVAYSPITKNHAGAGLRVSEICAAALEYSDNTAANLIIRFLGGPAGITRFTRSINDDEFRLDRWETPLNDAVPGDPRDTSTPAAMLKDLQVLALGDFLGAAERTILVNWMKGCTTGFKRIRAGVPAGWQVADKTGTGDYGTTNDVGVVWPPGKPPIVLAIYFTQGKKSAPPRDGVVAKAAGIVADTFN